MTILRSAHHIPSVLIIHSFTPLLVLRANGALIAQCSVNLYIQEEKRYPNHHQSSPEHMQAPSNLFKITLGKGRIISLLQHRTHHYIISLHCCMSVYHNYKLPVHITNTVPTILSQYQLFLVAK